MIEKSIHRIQIEKGLAEFTEEMNEYLQLCLLQLNPEFASLIDKEPRREISKNHECFAVKPPINYAMKSPGDLLEESKNGIFNVANDIYNYMHKNKFNKLSFIADARDINNPFPGYMAYDSSKIIPSALICLLGRDFMVSTDLLFLYCIIDFT